MSTVIQFLLIFLSDISVPRSLILLLNYIKTILRMFWILTGDLWLPLLSARMRERAPWVTSQSLINMLPTLSWGVILCVTVCYYFIITLHWYVFQYNLCYCHFEYRYKCYVYYTYSLKYCLLVSWLIDDVSLCYFVCVCFLSPLSTSRLKGT